MTEQSFATAMKELREKVGTGRLTGSVTVDQVYAHYQHEHPEFHHPRGGEAFFLQTPFYDYYRTYLTSFARSVLRDGGKGSLMSSMEHLSDQVEVKAPVEFADLRRSGHPQVSLNGHVIKDREPKVHRLTKEELRIKSRIRYMSLPDALKGWIWWHVQHHDKPPPRRHHG